MKVAERYSLTDQGWNFIFSLTGPQIWAMQDNFTKWEPLKDPQGDWIFGPKNTENIRKAAQMGLLDLRGDQYKWTDYGIRFTYVMSGLFEAQTHTDEEMEKHFTRQPVPYLELMSSIFSVQRGLDEVTKFFTGFFTGQPTMPKIPSPTGVDEILKKAEASGLVKRV